MELEGGAFLQRMGKAEIIGFSGLSIAIFACTLPYSSNQTKPATAAHMTALKAKCLPCHKPGKAQGGFDVNRIIVDPVNTRPSVAKEIAKEITKEIAKEIAKIAKRVKAGEMPPAGQPPLSADEKRVLLEWNAKLNPAPIKTGIPLPLRRLTHYEYDRTITDLLDIDFDSRTLVGMQDDGDGQSYDNQAAALSISPTLMEKYTIAADKILDRLIVGTNGKVAEVGDHWRADKAQKTLFFTKPVNGLSGHEAASLVLTKFVSRAYRRPISDNELARFLTAYDSLAKNNKSFEQTMRPLIKAVLISPQFLYRTEATVQNTNRMNINADDFALASRLSYFLWSTMPDQKLFDLATDNKLHDPSVLREQIARMLKDPKASTLTDNFAAQWLQIRKLAHARPSTDFFPTFSAGMRDAMFKETTAFFDHLRINDGSVLDLLSCDYTFVNEELAKHYGISGVTGDKMQLVHLNPETHRGGLLGMGSILSLTSHTYRTSPTLRGKWVLEVIFGTPPPPPPPGAGVIDDEQKKQTGGTTFRDLLAQHASRPACAGCHMKMDPLGFALENYDAVGRWRTKQGDKLVDTTAQLPTGEKLTGADELKSIIVSRKEAFVRNVITQMMAYANGRETTDFDTKQVDQIANNLKTSNYKFSELVQNIAASTPFLKACNSAEVSNVNRTANFTTSNHRLN